ncbi:MAG: VOC family protein [Micropepsaceae bacterium]
MPVTLGAYLTIDGTAAAIEFYKTAFGAEEVMRMPSEDGKTLMHADLKIFGQQVLLADEAPEFGNVKSPKNLGGTTFNMIVGLEAPADVDAAIARAAEAGAEVVVPAADQFWGARFGMVRDPFGHLWAFNADKPES